MKRTRWIIAAVVVTILVIGGALAFQQSRQSQAAEPDTAAVATSSSASTSTSSSATTSSSVAKKKHQRSSSSKKSTAKTTSASSATKPSARRQSTTASSVAASSSAAKSVTKRSKKAKTTNHQATKTKPAVKKTRSAAEAHLVVSGYKKTFFDGQVKLTSKSNAFTVLQSSKLKLVAQQGAAVYVSSINGLAQNDIKAGSGWKYRVNGKFIDKAANLKSVKNGDKVHWYFTTKGY